MLGAELVTPCSCQFSWGQVLDCRASARLDLGLISRSHRTHPKNPSTTNRRVLRLAMGDSRSLSPSQQPALPLRAGGKGGCALSLSPSRSDRQFLRSRSPSSPAAPWLPLPPQNTLARLFTRCESPCRCDVLQGQSLMAAGCWLLAAQLRRSSWGIAEILVRPYPHLHPLSGPSSAKAACLQWRLFSAGRPPCPAILWTKQDWQQPE